MANTDVRKYSKIGYFCTIVGSAGYYGYYLKNKDHLFLWLIIFFIGIISLAIKNNHMFKNGGKMPVLTDMVFVFLVCLMPAMLDLPRGLGILAMTFTGALYGYLMIRNIA